MPEFPHGDSIFKQIAREMLLANVYASFTDRRQSLRVLTFPSFAGVENPKSVEAKLTEGYRHCSLTGVENQRETYLSILPKALELGMTLHWASDSDLFRFFQVPKAGPFHVIFSDYMGGLDDDMLRGWNLMLDRGWLSRGGVWGVTLNDSGRCQEKNRRLLGDEELIVSLPKAMIRLMSEHGYKPSLKAQPWGYSCRDESSKAVPMVIAIVSDLRVKQNLSAYQDTDR